MWFLICIIVLALIILHIIIPRKYNWPDTTRKLSKLPGPVGVPYFDNALSLNISNEEFIPFLVKLVQQYTPICKLTVLGRSFIFITDLNDIEVILNSRKHIKKGTEYNFLIPWLGTGLLISNGKKWFDHRKLLTPAFHFTILEQYISIMNKNANILCSLLQSHDEESYIEINPLISNCALDIICETAMGTKVNAQTGGEKEYVKSIIRMSQIFTERSLSPWLFRPQVFNLFPLGREHNKILKVVHSLTEKVIKERQAAYKESNTLKNGKKCESSEFEDLLIEISETQSSLTETEIREEVDTFMFEGHDTTASAMTWALLEMALNPEIQEKVYQEQYNLFHGSNRQPDFTDLQKMKYLERVIKETLRLYPSVPIISRELEEEIKIRDYILPPETEILIFIYYIHKNPIMYPEPDKFNPDRFLPETLRGRHPYSYIPFSAGPRNCIGQKFAMMEEKIILSNIIRKFKISTTETRDNIKLMGEVVLRPKNNIKMKFTER